MIICIGVLTTELDGQFSFPKRGAAIWHDKTVSLGGPDFFSDEKRSASAYRIKHATGCGSCLEFLYINNPEVFFDAFRGSRTGQPRPGTVRWEGQEQSGFCVIATSAWETDGARVPWSWLTVSGRTSFILCTRRVEPIICRLLQRFPPLATAIFRFLLKRVAYLYGAWKSWLSVGRRLLMHFGLAGALMVFYGVLYPDWASCPKIVQSSDRRIDQKRGTKPTFLNS